MKNILKKHRHSVTALGYSGEQAEDIILKFSAIMNAFIDVAWGVHSAQLSKRENTKKCLPETPICGRIRTKAKQSDQKGSAAPPADEIWIR